MPPGHSLVIGCMVMATSADKLPGGTIKSIRPSALEIVPPATPIVFVTGFPIGVPTAVIAIEVSLLFDELPPEPGELDFLQLHANVRISRKE